MVYVDTVQSSNNNTNSGGLGGQRERQKERGQERERESRAFDADALPPVLKTERVEPSLRRSGALFRQLLCRRFLPPFPHCTFSWNSNVDRNRSKFVSPANWIEENPSPNPKSQIANRNRGIYIPSRRLLSFFSSCPKTIERRVCRAATPPTIAQIHSSSRSRWRRRLPKTADKILIALPTTFHSHWAKELYQQQRRGAAFVAL